MIERNDLQRWVVDALMHYGGRARLIDVAKHIWRNHREELEASGDLLFKWQYDMRWAATVLRKKGKLRAAEDSERGVWELVS